MSDSWTIARLSDVLSEISDRAGKQNLDVLSVTEKRGIIPQSDVFNRRIATEDISDYKVLEPLDIAFNPYLLWAGAIGQWMGETRGVVSPVYPCFRAKESENSRWLGLVFESAVLRPYFDSTAIGSIVRRRRTTIPVFLNAELQRPPRSVQNRIVDVISSVDSYIAALQQQVDASRVARAAVLSELLSAGGEDWTETTLGEVADTRLGKMLSATTDDGSGTLYPYLRNANVRWGDIDLTSLKEMRFSRQDRDVFALLAGDLLICEGGEPGRAALLKHDLPGIYFQKALHRVRCRPGLDPEFLCYWIYHLSKAEIFQNFLTSTTIQHLTGEKLRQLPIVLPPIIEQRRIVSVISSLDEAIRSTEQAVAESMRLRSGLLSELLSGSHEIPESYDRLLGAA